jgi:general secretion pathway protein G
MKVAASGRGFSQRRHRAVARGFTLIETMLVVGLIGTLIGVSVPSYRSYRDRARAGMAAQEITAMAGAVQRFELERRALPDSLGDVGLGGKLDPWGRPYVYYNVEANGRGGARKDRRLNPLNTDFDLYSLGPDGKTKPQVGQKDSLDDVIRASNGRFVGNAADF